MRKKGLLFSILLLVAMVFGPVGANAATVSYEIFGSKDKEMTETSMAGSSFTIENKGSSTAFYLGVNVTSGTLNEYSLTLKFDSPYYTYNRFTPESGWTKVNEDISTDKKTVTLTLKNTSGVTGKKLVGTVRVAVDNDATSTDKCTITLNGADTPETPVTPKCKVVDGKYYNDKGVEVTKEEYDKACTSTNPETGAFLSIAVIGLGVAVVVGLFFATKNNKMYQV